VRSNVKCQNILDFLECLPRILPLVAKFPDTLLTFPSVYLPIHILNGYVKAPIISPAQPIHPLAAST